MKTYNGKSINVGYIKQTKKNPACDDKAKEIYLIVSIKIKPFIKLIR